MEIGRKRWPMPLNGLTIRVADFLVVIEREGIRVDDPYGLANSIVEKLEKAGIRTSGDLQLKRKSLARIPFTHREHRLVLAAAEYWG